MKHRKQLVINGKDYVRTRKTSSRSWCSAQSRSLNGRRSSSASRGKQFRLSQAQLLGCGVHTFGYEYVRKTPASAPRIIVNEREAEIVRYVFETYAGTQIGMDRIAQHLEKRGGR